MDADFGDIDDNEGVDEGASRGPKHIRDIRTPSQEEVERHNLTHLPFRNWCPRCMKGRGKEAPHRKSEGGRGDLPEISLDFCFPSKEDGTGMLTILAARERHTLTHLPFRNWCPRCMKGRGKEAPHRKSEGGGEISPK